MVDIQTNAFYSFTDEIVAKRLVTNYGEGGLQNGRGGM